MEISRIKTLAGIDEDSNTETVLIKGYGTMRRDQLENNVLSEIEQLREMAELKNWEALMLSIDGVFKLKVQTLIDTDKNT